MTLFNSTSFFQADVETTMYSPEEGIIGQNLATPAALQVLSTLTNPSAPPKPSDPKFSQFDDDDSEDDVPLSDLSRVTTDDSLKRPRPLSPSVPDEEPTRSKRRTVSCDMRTLVLHESRCYLT